MVVLEKLDPTISVTTTISIPLQVTLYVIIGTYIHMKMRMSLFLKVLVHTRHDSQITGFMTDTTHISGEHKTSLNFVKKLNLDFMFFGLAGIFFSVTYFTFGVKW